VTSTQTGSVPVPDARLEAAIADSIGRDAILSPQSIHATVANGAVTLTGTVRTLAQKWRAGRVVADFKGASSVVNAIVVGSPIRSDADLAKDVNASIKSDPATRTADVRATTSVGKVTLKGVADSSAQRDLAGELASRVRGVQAVTVAVTLRMATRGDAEVRGAVADELLEDARLDGTRVTVEAHSGDVVLSGVVGSIAQRDAAVKDASRAGARNVDAKGVRVDWLESALSRAVGQRGAPTDDEISAAVGRRLSNDVRIGAQLPSVRVDGGDVTLAGNVTDLRAESASHEDTLRVRGVRQIEDRMTALPVLRESDATIEKQALAGIYDDVAAPDSRNVRVVATNARVILQGVVASQEDKKIIEDDVDEVPGVVAVENDLKVGGYGPQTVVVPPETIRHRVIEGIFWDPRVDAGKITVDVDPAGDATLNGVVDSQDEARAAEADAIRAGAATVVNRVQVAK
jgi:osmotically-inducible protein OsmY